MLLKLIHQLSCVFFMLQLCCGQCLRTFIWVWISCIVSFEASVTKIFLVIPLGFGWNLKPCWSNVKKSLLLVEWIAMLYWTFCNCSALSPNVVSDILYVVNVSNFLRVCHVWKVSHVRVPVCNCAITWYDFQFSRVATFETS